MPCKTPDFWYKNNSLITKTLSPLSFIYNAIHKANTKIQKENSVDIPVICIGNLIAGGSGKTPTAIAIHKLIKDYKIKENPSFLTRGYGAKNPETRFISVHEPTHDTGDEPRLLLKHCKTIISKNRYTGAMLAQKEGHDVIIMDDGLQNKTLKKDISFLVIDGKFGFGNRKTIPAGPLREPVKTGLHAVDAVILIGEDTHNLNKQIPPNIPIFNASIKADTTNLNTSESYIAFCGLAHPKKFFNTLNRERFKISKTYEFADHHHYKNAEIENLLNEAQENGAKLITTEKDMMRIAPEYSNIISTLPISIEFTDAQQLQDFLKNKLTQSIDTP